MLYHVQATDGYDAWHEGSFENVERAIECAEDYWHHLTRNEKRRCTVIVLYYPADPDAGWNEPEDPGYNDVHRLDWDVEKEREEQRWLETYAYDEDD